jgi:hypothetical protein
MTDESELRRWAIEQAAASGARNVIEEAQRILEFTRGPQPKKKKHTATPLVIANLVRARAIWKAKREAKKEEPI